MAARVEKRSGKLRKSIGALSGGGVLARLRSSAEDLSPALARVCSYVLAQPELILSQTITEVAEQSGSSEASIIRFCREQGFRSFQDLKLALVAELASDATLADRPGARGSDALIDATIDALHDTRVLVDETSLDTASQQLLRARRIHLVGFGSSATVLQYLHYRLIRLGLPTTFGDDPHMSSMIISAYGKNDVVVAVSTSGSTRDTVLIGEVARAAGAFLLTITSRSKSPLANISNLVLTGASTGSLPEDSGFPTRISQLFIVESLFERIAKRDRRALLAVKSTLKSVAERVY
jgi:RpiR family transcriptional regulator, carbohydrate utilization regulator